MDAFPLRQRWPLDHSINFSFPVSYLDFSEDHFFPPYEVQSPLSKKGVCSRPPQGDANCDELSGASSPYLRPVSFKRKKSSSQYKGVLYVKSHSKWRAQLCFKGKKKCIGSFDSEKEAAIARDVKVIEMFGNIPKLLNFPVEASRDYAALQESKKETEQF